MNRKIKRAAVLGSGVMGARIACHFANIGLQVELLDIVPFELSEEEKQQPEARNRLVNNSLKAALKSNPSPIYDPRFAARIRTGNFDDHLDRIKDCDWVIEVVIERLDIKQQLFEKVERHRAPGTLITSNTSGIPMEMLIKDRSNDFQKHFCGTHFFNPPRYLRLLEVIPSSKTDPEVIDFFMHYGEKFLGKQTVLCKDTPAFIANRVGVFSIMAIFHIMEEMGLSVEDVDALTGPMTGRPKSATFRTCDVVGIDTLAKVATGVKENCPDDEAASLFEIPTYVDKLIDNKWIGDKTGQGFYKKTKDANGQTNILALDLNSFQYRDKQKATFPVIAQARQIDDLKERLKTIIKADDKGAEFLRRLNYRLFSYVSHRIPGIADELYRIDDAIRAGFGWELGPFEQWDVLGVREQAAAVEEAGLPIANWVNDMLEAGADSFYKIDGGIRKYYDIGSKSYQTIPGQDAFIILDNLRNQTPVYENSGCTVHDLGDGVLNVEFRTKMNSLGGEVLQGINQAINLAEEGEFRGVVIGNDGANFSAGANLGMIFMLAIEQEYDELNLAVQQFQRTVMRLRYSSVPVVIAPHGMTLGGGCEMTMHADAAVVAAETYIGLVEVGVGVIPGGGGTKETVLRISDSFYEGDPKLPKLQHRFVDIATAKVATSGYEGYSIGVLNPGKDIIIVNRDRLLATARRKVIELDEQGYTRPIERTDIEVLGRTALGPLLAGTAGFEMGGYATAYDVKIANKLAYVMAGGDLSAATLVSEQYLLDLEREAFLSLLGEKKTLERIQSVLKGGRPVRN